MFHVVGGWYFSGVLHERALSGEARRASNDLDPDLVVQAIDRLDDRAPARRRRAPERSTTPGVYGLRWEGGNGTLGEVLEVEGDDVARTFQLLDGDGTRRRGRAPSSTCASTPTRREAGVDVEDVTIDGPLGAYPAWFVAGRRATRGSIVVHGNSLSRLDGVRWLPALRDAGYPSLTITYRNDAGAPGGSERAAAVRADRVGGPRGGGPLRPRPGIRRRGAVRASMGGGVAASFMAALGAGRAGPGARARRPDARLRPDRRRQRRARTAGRPDQRATDASPWTAQAIADAALRRRLVRARLPRRTRRRSASCRS